MPNSIGVSLGLTAPQVSITDGPDWATLVNDFLLGLQEACETGVLISTGGLTIDANVPMNGYPLINCGAVLFAEQASPAFVNNMIFTQDDGELHFIDRVGNNVQITADGTLNASALGGIVGDYGGVNPAKVTYVDSGSTYIFSQDPSVPARIDVGDVKIRETGAISPNAITLKSPASLLSAYTVTLPTALPAATSLVMMSSAGALSLTKSPTLTNLTLDGTTVTATGVTATLTGVIASGPVSADTVTIGGSGGLELGNGAYLKHGDWFTAFHASMGSPSDPSLFSLTAGYYLASGTSSIHIPIPLRVDDKLTAVRVYIKDTGTASTMAVYNVDLTDGTSVQLGSTQTSAGDTANHPLTVIGLSYTSVANHAILVIVTTAASHRLYGGYYITNNL